jgi:hypothetical protein
MSSGKSSGRIEIQECSSFGACYVPLSPKSNAEQVGRIVTIARQLSKETATHDEAREILDLKGLEKVSW